MASSPPTTPRTHRTYQGRVLRSQTKNRRADQERDTTSITQFFNVRKRLSSSFPEKCSPRKRGLVITDAEAVTPNNLLPIDSPVVCLSPDRMPDTIPSPPKRIRQLSALGVFDTLCNQERFDFMSALPLSYFSKLALTSRTWTACIKNYVESGSFRKRFIAMTNDHGMGMNIEDPFRAVGEILKAFTVSMLPAARIEVLVNFIDKCNGKIEEYDGWGRLIQRFTERWAFHEMAKIVKAFKDMNGGRFAMLIRTVMKAEPGSQSKLEMEVRQLARGFFLGPLASNTATSHEKRTSGFWLSAILKSLTNIQCQGRFCMIVFGPTTIADGVEVVNWRDLVERPVTSAAEAEKQLKPLAWAIASLSKLRDHCAGITSNFVWRQDEIFNLIEEITTFPDPWSFDNFVALLMQKSALLPITVCTRICHGHRDEAGQIINSMKTLLYRWNININSVMGRPFRHIIETLDGGHKTLLLNAVLDAHFTQCRELVAMGLAGQAIYDEEIWAQHAFLPLLFEAADVLRQPAVG